ncbi:SRPBCC family protein [Georgenia subflava]|uniref:SRPBCC family protein n=1 Tax=Georgenia subflava TaxID=1622177 RepID=A0A6N7EK53_9MICO|nr:SRPBCC family protein [Georgenia subflava]MPV38732.1 SRPBCC family protein [Georgenia subflava]
MRRALPVPAAAAFGLLTDLAGHHRWIPLTRTDAPPAPPRPGDLLTAVTAGVLPDRMVVTEVRAPAGDTAGVLRVRKEGPLLLGPVTIAVEPAGHDRCTVRWTEEVWLRGPLPRPLTRLLLAPTLEAMTAVALRWVARHLDERRAG